jgi:hypothetical protein
MIFEKAIIKGDTLSVQVNYTNKIGEVIDLKECKVFYTLLNPFTKEIISPTEQVQLEGDTFYIPSSKTQDLRDVVSVRIKVINNLFVTQKDINIKIEE